MHKHGFAKRDVAVWDKMNHLRFVVLLVCVCIAPEIAHSLTTSPVGSPGPDGWTVFTPSPDSIIVYVSSSAGLDTNSGLSASTPVRSIAKASSLLRWGKPDWMLLKKGDVWANETLGSWGISGRSPAEPNLVSSYGTGPRPVIAGSGGSGIGYNGSTPQHDIAIVGIHFQRSTEPPKESIRWLGNVTNLLFEDCVMEGPVIVQASKFADIKNFAMRRCQIIDVYHPEKSQGLYIQRTQGIFLEENLFDNNGYLDVSGSIGPSLVVNHNVYVQKDCEDFAARGNISMRAPSHGMQARVGGLVDNNLFLNNAMAVVVGNGKGVSKITRNVILDGKDIPRDGAETLYRAWGIELTDIDPHDGAIVEGNIIAHEDSGEPFPVGIVLSNVVKNAIVYKNIVYDWRRPLMLGSTPGTSLGDVTIASNLFQGNDVDRALVEVRHSSSLSTFVSFFDNVYYNTSQPQSKWFYLDAAQYLDPVTWITRSAEVNPHVNEVAFADASRTILTYQASLGYPPTIESFIEQVRSQSKDTWRPEYSAPVINDYFRAGFTPTNEWAVSPDTTAPFPGLILTVQQVADTVEVTYAGALDEIGGSGLKEVRLWRRIDTGPWEATRRVRLGAFAVAGKFVFEELANSGQYYFALVATDFAGNTSESPPDSFFPATAQLTYVRPTSTVPVVSVVGSDPYIIRQNRIYSDPGATAYDLEDGDLTPYVQTDMTNLDMGAVGDYTIKYTVLDTSGLAARPAERTVSVIPAGDPPADAPLGTGLWVGLVAGFAGLGTYSLRKQRKN